MPYCFFQTFGCQMNVADSDELQRMLSERGYLSTSNPNDADLIIVNTCSVRDHAEQRAKTRIAEFARQKRKGARLWVIGCMAERLGDTLKQEITGIDTVIGAKAIDKMDQYLARYLPGSTDEHTGIVKKSEVSDFVAVMRGCNNYCAYCIVPYVRGPEMSISADQITESVRKKVDQGICEITLLGQNVNSYNDNGIDFADLLVKVAAIDGIKRIRFTTSHPKDCSEKLIKTIADNQKLCHHFHLPFQAGSDRILSLMNRRYSASQYLDLIDKIRQFVPDADITTDILVGFPSETEEDFEQTLSIVKKVRFTTAFMFAYSIREGTKAAEMTDNIDELVKISRLNRLIDLQTAITRQIYEQTVGKQIEILISGRQEKRDKMWMGIDNGCKRTLLSCENVKAGMILNVRAVKSSGMTLICERV
ncbi:MAG: tRNA (N6-isopentenyl adenosine(37)-C2)-methylthiotransferase MiaB [Fibrobacter sp.]|nr:tRNA (N6-isopentenyl adenosine(37)-C2)-methylthiotransferase MiaB [Fibrobacter sp.]